MNLLHICIYYRNPMFNGLINSQKRMHYNLRVLYYETRKIGLKKIDQPFVDSMPSDVWYLPSSYLRLTRLKLVCKKMEDLYSNNHNFDLIHAHTLCQDGYLALHMYQKWRIPYVVTVRSCDLSSDNCWFFSRNYETYSEVLRNSKAVTFLSISAKNALFKKIKDERLKEIIDRKSTIIHNGIDSFWHEHSIDSDRKTFSDKDLEIITVGRIEENKNQLIVARAIEEHLLRNGYSITYTVVGKPMKQNYLEKLKAYDFLTIHKFCNKEELIDLYRKADLFVLMSHQESFGLTYVEAMSQGLPVIYTKGQGFDGQYDEGEVGFSADDKDPKTVSEAIIHALNNYQAISKRCIQYSKNYSWESIAQQYGSVYDNGDN